MAKRLVEMNARKREERLVEDKHQLEKLIGIKKYYERGETKEYQKQMRQNLLNNHDELEVVVNCELCASLCVTKHHFCLPITEINSSGKESD